jgi:hypothetical protein
MRKIISTILVIVMGAGSLFAAPALLSYTVQPSTYPITESTTMAAQKSGDTIQVKGIAIHQSNTTAQVIYLYKNAASTTTVAEVTEYSVPGAIGDYWVPIPGNGDSQFLSTNLLNAPNFCLRSSSNTNTPRVTVYYVKP